MSGCLKALLNVTAKIVAQRKSLEQCPNRRRYKIINGGGTPTRPTSQKSHNNMGTH